MNREHRMPEPLVLDASAAIAIIRAEPQGPAIAALLEGHVAADGRVVVPGHFWLEVGNVLLRRYGFAPERIVGEMQTLDGFAIETIHIDRTLVLLLLDRMWSLNLSAYDAAYLALTESLAASLVTLDGRLAAAAGSWALPRGPHRLAESLSNYKVSDPSEVWAQFGGYLAELRREAAAG
jgi:predicted nucleic acid-binding protein